MGGVISNGVISGGVISGCSGVGGMISDGCGNERVW